MKRKGSQDLLAFFVRLLNERARMLQVAIDESIGGAIGKSENGCRGI